MKRPVWRSLADALVFIVLLALVLMALQRAGLIDLGTVGYDVIDDDSLRRGAADD